MFVIDSGCVEGQQSPTGKVWADVRLVEYIIISKKWTNCFLALLQNFFLNMIQYKNFLNCNKQI